nr:GSCFA domain-containing protein [uncultured Rhodopila sp.]
MPNPYDSKGPAHFWRSGVAILSPRDVWPIPSRSFRIPSRARIATAGSCFAQEVARVLVGLPEVEFMQTEQSAPDQPLFSARYGNIYTVRQLRQLLFEAFSLIPRIDVAWRREDGRWVDAQRPAMFAAGFDSAADVALARTEHLASVRRLFSECSIFIFTLGLTEAWTSASGDVVFPIAPGIVAEDVSGGSYTFHNFSYDEIIADLGDFITEIRKINPAVRCILTVSPVPLVATYTDEHVLVATTHSKSILRAVCSAAETRWEDVFYFPSYEIISSHFNNGAYYNDNKRTIAKSGVEHVMDVFQETYFGGKPGTPERVQEEPKSMLDEAFESVDKVICDEELITKSFGF